jgi:hypothetical protein
MPTERPKSQRKKRRSPSGSSAAPSPSEARGGEGPVEVRVVAEDPNGPLLAKVALWAAGAYLLALFCAGGAPRLVENFVPATARYFVQATCLFPRAGSMGIDYRLEGWDCASRRFRELHPAAYFPIRPNDKESRYHRTAHFFRRHREVMEALEGYVLEQENARTRPPKWGGIRVSSLRHPLPAVGEGVTRWDRRPMEQHPKELTKQWFYTPVARRMEQCQSLGFASGTRSGGQP